MHLSRNNSVRSRPIQVLLLSLAALALAPALPGQQLPSAGTAQTNLAAAPRAVWDTFSDTWVATDALGRSLPSCAEAGLPRKNRTVGAFYFLWHYPNGASARSTSPKSSPGTRKPSPMPPARSGGRCTSSITGGNPYLATTSRTTKAVLRKHAQMLADAGVDVIIFDVTNQLTYPRSWKTLCRVFDQIRREGGQTPQIAFLCPFWDPKKVARELWEQLYSRGCIPSSGSAGRANRSSWPIPR